MTDLTYGVLRWRGLLDFILAAHSNRPLAKIDLVPLTSLRIGLYQLRFSSKIPARAAVADSVHLVRELGVSSAAGFVNAVLRSAQRSPGVPTLPERASDPLGYLSTTLSHPRWLAKRYLERLGLDDAEARCRRQNQPPPLYVRVAPPCDLDEARDRLEREDVTSELAPIAPRALAVIRGDLYGTKLYRDGGVSVQDAGAQLVASLLAPSPGDSILDLCAAPGGKATAIAEQAPEALVVAIDRRHARSRLVRELAMRLGRRNVHTITADGARLPFSREFEHVLVDAPCTSLGTLQRNPDIKWRLEQSDVPRHQSLQLELLRSGAGALAPRGTLIYATCSTEPEENEDVVSAFLASSPGFRVVSSPLHGNRDGFFETRPERDGTDGYFAAILTRSD